MLTHGCLDRESRVGCYPRRQRRIGNRYSILINYLQRREKSESRITSILFLWTCVLIISTRPAVTLYDTREGHTHQSNRQRAYYCPEKRQENLGRTDKLARKFRSLPFFTAFRRYGTVHYAVEVEEPEGSTA